MVDAAGVGVSDREGMPLLPNTLINLMHPMTTVHTLSGCQFSQPPTRMSDCLTSWAITCSIMLTVCAAVLPAGSWRALPQRAGLGGHQHSGPGSGSRSIPVARGTQPRPRVTAQIPLAAGGHSDTLKHACSDVYLSRWTANLGICRC